MREELTIAVEFRPISLGNYLPRRPEQRRDGLSLDDEGVSDVPAMEVGNQ